MEETIIFRMKIEGNDIIIRNQQELSSTLAKSRKALKGLGDDGSESYKKLAKDVATLEAIQGEYRDESRKTKAEVIANNRAEEGSYNQLKARLESLKITYRQLGTEARESTEGKALKANIDQVRKEFDGLRDNLGEGLFNNFNRALNSASEAIGGALLGDIGALAGALGASGPLAASFQFLGEGLALLQEMSDRIYTLQQDLNRLTDLTGEGLTDATAKMVALADTFGVDDNDLILAANSLTKQLTGDLSESLDLIEAGFLAGADANGEFLDSIKEYPAFFKEAKLSGEQFISVISQGVTSGVFSDKAPDLIKEFNVSMRELTTSTQDALVKIGLSSEQVTKVIKEEGIGAAFNVVQAQLQKFADDSPEVGAALADIFRGPGEDAGAQFVKNLDLSQKELGDLVDATNEYVAFQQRQLESTEALAQAQQELFGVTQPFVDELRFLKQDVLTGVITGLSTFAEIVKALPGFLRENKEELLLLAGAVLYFNQGLIISTALQIKDNAVKAVAAARTAALAARQAILNAVLIANPIGIVVAALTALSIAFVAAYKRSEEFRAVIQGLGAVAKEFFELVTEALGSFLEGFGQLSEGNFKGALQSFGEVLKKGNPIGIAFTQGERLSDAYQDGYRKSLLKSSQDASDLLEGAVVDPMIEAGEKAAEEADKAGKKAGKALGDGVGKGLEDAAIDPKPVAGSIEAIRGEIQKLNQEISRGNLSEGDLSKALAEIVAKESELEILQLRIAQVKQELEGGIDFPEIKKIVLADEEIDVEDELQKVLDAELENLDKARLQELQSLASRNLEYEAYQKERAAINEDYEMQRLELQKLLAVEGSKEYLSILDQQQVAELEAEQRQTDAITAKRQARLQQIGQYVGEAIGIFSQFAAAQGAIQEQEIEQEAQAQQQALDEEQERRLQGVESGSEQEQQINEEFDQRKVELERQTAAKQKEIRIKQQKINIALAVGNALATVQPFIPAALIAAGIAATKGAIELAVIQRQGFAGGGPTGEGIGSPDATGYRPVGIVHEHEYVVPTKVYRHPAAQSPLRKLERMRLAMGYPYQPGAARGRSFATGGATSTTAGATVFDVSQSVEVQLTPENVELLAVAIGRSSEEGTRRGATAGIAETEKMQERRGDLNERINI